MGEDKTVTWHSDSCSDLGKVLLNGRQSKLELWRRSCAIATSLMSDSDSETSSEESDSSSSESEDESDTGMRTIRTGTPAERAVRAQRARQIFTKWQDDRGRTGRRQTHQSHASGAMYHDANEMRDMADEVKKRAGEMCIQMQLKSIARRQTLRYNLGTARRTLPTGVASAARDSTASLDEMYAQTQSAPAAFGGEHSMGIAQSRRAVGQEANRFDESYATVQEVIEHRLTFTAPVRSNTAGMGELARALCLADDEGCSITREESFGVPHRRASSPVLPGSRTFAAVHFGNSDNKADESDESKESEQSLSEWSGSEASGAEDMAEVDMRTIRTWGWRRRKQAVSPP